MSLQGNLATFSLDEVLQLLAETAKTGTLHVAGDGARGVLHLADGDLCGAELDDVVGRLPSGLDARVLDACFAFARLADGEFEFETARGGSAGPVVDALPVAVLLGRLRPLIDEWPAIARVVPSFDVRPALAKELADDVVTIDRASWSVLVTVDGSRSVRDIAAELDRSAAEVAGALRTLVTAGAVTTGGVDAPAALTLVRDPEFDVVVVDDANPRTEGPDALARLDRAALERAALGEPVGDDDVEPAGYEDVEPAVEIEPVVEIEPFDDVEPVVEVAAVHEIEDAPVETAVEVLDPDEAVDEDDLDPDAPHPAVPRDRGALLRMFSALRDG
ncbi:MAG TPA: DUF4388 domain-containing protein [Acidimicrobiia bacterium]|nr:DUF4388 domain-containing protein [Acidimicrobiia bacterium]